MTLQIVSQSKARSAQALYRFTRPQLEFLESNLESLTLGVTTARAVRRARDQYKVVTRLDGAPQVERKGKFLGAPISHRDLAKTLQDVGEDSIVVVFGIGCGQSARTVRSMCRVPVLVYEPDPSVLRSVLSFGPLALGDVPIVSGLSDLAWYWRQFKGRELNVRVVVTPGYREAYPQDVRAFLDEVPSLLQRTAISRATYNCRAQVWVRDILDNLDCLVTAPPFLRLENAYAGIPAFIVGAGPSLDKNIQHLRDAAKRGIVFATNSGALALARHGIEPQVVVCIESIDCSDKLRQLPCLERSIRAFSLSAAPENLTVGNGPLLPLHEAISQIDGPLQQLTGVSGVLTLGSVSTTALSLARICGCTPIVLVGQDLAYTDGSTYAEGTGYESSEAQVDEDSGRVNMKWNTESRRVHGTQQGAFARSEKLRMVERWGGGKPVASTVAFSAVRQWFEGLARLLNNTTDRPRLINATEGGGRITGYEELPLADVVDGLPVRKNLTPQQLAAQAALDWRAPSAQFLIDWLNGLRRQARTVQLRARRCRRIANYARRAMRSGDSQVVMIAYARLDAAEQNLRASVWQCPMVDAWSHRAVDKAVGDPFPATEDAQKIALNAMVRSARVAGAVERSAKEFRQYMSLGRKRLEAQIAATKQESPEA